jgi:hypothetical protein
MKRDDLIKKLLDLPQNAEIVILTEDDGESKYLPSISLSERNVIKDSF